MIHSFRCYLDQDGQFTMTDCALPPRDEQLYTIDQAAALLKLNPDKLREAVEAGVIRSHTGLARTPLLRLADILAAIDFSLDGGWR
jgi:hypothetical protein